MVVDWRSSSLTMKAYMVLEILVLLPAYKRSDERNLRNLRWK